MQDRLWFVRLAIITASVTAILTLIALLSSYSEYGHIDWFIACLFCGSFFVAIGIVLPIPLFRINPEKQKREKDM